LSTQYILFHLKSPKTHHYALNYTIRSYK